MLAEIADLFQRPEGIDMFYYLADRKALLFPEEERFICKVETEPALDSRCRIASCVGDVSVTIAAYDLGRFDEQKSTDVQLFEIL
jgi:hypothetical protein